MYEITYLTLWSRSEPMSSTLESLMSYSFRWTSPSCGGIFSDLRLRVAQGRYILFWIGNWLKEMVQCIVSLKAVCFWCRAKTMDVDWSIGRSFPLLMLTLKLVKHHLFCSSSRISCQRMSENARECWMFNDCVNNAKNSTPHHCLALTTLSWERVQW
jgi:hypothetical protein